MSLTLITLERRLTDESRFTVQKRDLYAATNKNIQFLQTNKIMSCFASLILHNRYPTLEYIGVLKIRFSRCFLSPSAFRAPEKLTTHCWEALGTRVSRIDYRQWATILSWENGVFRIPENWKWLNKKWCRLSKCKSTQNWIHAQTHLHYKKL